MKKEVSTLPPYVLTDLKRYLKSKGIKHSRWSPNQISIEQSKFLPALLFRFERTPDYVNVFPIPVNGFSISFKAQTAEILIQKLLKFRCALELYRRS